ncbi:hypothetical protein AXF42_Ash012985 [Apostasia shenzhenica]|uniref:DUF7755 domain-containing protein n=1 Tax=Apostasia shenzhenica TaxID=1088818 RepID=A0A2I0ARU7_9ASPA|nr:hypothetical protein AXF42_Ash012985 [Apostasia shenzhenica]
MECLCTNHLTPSTQAYVFPRRHRQQITTQEFSRNPLFKRRRANLMGCFRFISSSKNSWYQDFQDFAKPSYLFSATEVTISPLHLSEEIISSLELDQSSSFYIVDLCTNRDFGSSLRDINAAILLCLIDENGNSILQRIPAVSLKSPKEDKDLIPSECIHFQRGSVDIVTFKGVKLENIAALWMGLESGSWRVDSIGLKVINGPIASSTSAEDTQEGSFSGLQYKFHANTLLLGDGGGLPVVELKPIQVSQLSKDNISSLSSRNSSPLAPSSESDLSREESMKEYADLKLSLLLYDFILVVTGSSILTVVSSERNACSFFIGGFGGFLYLFLIQRSVDGLSVPIKKYGGVKGPVLSLAFAVASTIIAAKYWMTGPTVLFSPLELFVGTAGFLTCKIAIVLAAFKPIQMSTTRKKFY